MAELMSTEEAARVLGVSVRRVRQLCRSYNLGTRIGGRWVLDAEEIDRFRKLNRPPHRPSRLTRSATGSGPQG